MIPVTREPPVHIALPGHPPAPARVWLERLPLRGRCARTAISLLLCWGIVPLAMWIPPHYPWPLLFVFVGAYLAHLYWTGRYRVWYFLGTCPRCARPLRIDAGTRVSMPHTLTCYACHFEPRLELEARTMVEDGMLRHAHADCTGRWSEQRLWNNGYLVCAGCGMQHRANVETGLAATSENRRGELLEQLTYEGRFL